MFVCDALTRLGVPASLFVMYLHVGETDHGQSHTPYPLLQNINR